MKQAKQYFSKMLMLLPLTFLVTPLFDAFLGRHPEIPVFPFLVYLWAAFSVYLGMTVAFILRKYKYIAYPIIIALAFLCRNAITPLTVYFKKTEMVLIGESIEYIFVPIDQSDVMYYKAVLFVMSMIAGFAGIHFSRKTALDFVSRRNTFFFVNIWILSSLVFGNIFYLASFIVSYFLVRNFAYLNRQLEIYAEHGAYNVSGTKKIYAYYFSTVLYLSILPMIFCFVFVPYVVNFIKYIAWKLFASLKFTPTESEELPPSVELPEDPLTQSLLVENELRERIVYYIFIAIFLIIVFIFRKNIVKIIKEIIEYFKTKMNLTGLSKNMIINQEIITEVKKDKKLKSSYRDYLKQVRKIKDLRQKFLFAYNYIFWNIIKKDEVLKESATPNEVAEKYQETQSLAKLYQDLKYGNKLDGRIEIKPEIEKAEIFLKDFL